MDVLNDFKKKIMMTKKTDRKAFPSCKKQEQKSQYY